MGVRISLPEDACLTFHPDLPLKLKRRTLERSSDGKGRNQRTEDLILLSSFHGQSVGMMDGLVAVFALFTSALLILTVTEAVRSDERESRFELWVF